MKIEMQGRLIRFIRANAGSTKETVIQCKTLKQAKVLACNFNYLGWKWQGSNDVIDSTHLNYDSYGRDTCYSLNTSDKRLTYGSKGYCLLNDNRIVNLKQILRGEVE